MENSLVGEERESSYLAQAGYIKGAHEVGKDLVFDIQSQNSGTAAQTCKSDIIITKGMTVMAPDVQTADSCFGLASFPGPIPSFLMFHAETLKSWVYRAWGRG